MQIKQQNLPYNVISVHEFSALIFVIIFGEVVVIFIRIILRRDGFVKFFCFFGFVPKHDFRMPKDL